MVRWYVQPALADAPKWEAIGWQRNGWDTHPGVGKVALLMCEIPDAARPPMPVDVLTAKMQHGTDANTTTFPAPRR